MMEMSLYFGFPLLGRAIWFTWTYFLDLPTLVPPCQPPLGAPVMALSLLTMMLGGALATKPWRKDRGASLTNLTCAIGVALHISSSACPVVVGP